MVGHNVQFPPYSESLHSFHVNAKRGAELTPNSNHVEGNGRPSAQEVSLLETRLGPAPCEPPAGRCFFQPVLSSGSSFSYRRSLCSPAGVFTYTHIFLNSETFPKLRASGHKSNPQWWRERTPFSQVLQFMYTDHVSQGCDDLCPRLETGSWEEAETASLLRPVGGATTASPVWGSPRHLQEISPCSYSGV